MQFTRLGFSMFRLEIEHVTPEVAYAVVPVIHTRNTMRALVKPGRRASR
jgi:hypothetical protein